MILFERLLIEAVPKIIETSLTRNQQDHGLPVASTISTIIFRSVL